jgi:hypothetical protein
VVATEAVQGALVVVVPGGGRDVQPAVEELREGTGLAGVDARVQDARTAGGVRAAAEFPSLDPAGDGVVGALDADEDAAPRAATGGAAAADLGGVGEDEDVVGVDEQQPGRRGPSADVRPQGADLVQEAAPALAPAEDGQREAVAAAGRPQCVHPAVGVGGDGDHLDVRHGWIGRFSI